MSKFTKESEYPFNGKYKGIKLKDVPSWYLIQLYDNNRSGRLKEYIEENMETLEQETYSKPLGFVKNMKNSK